MKYTKYILFAFSAMALWQCNNSDIPVVAETIKLSKDPNGIGAITELHLTPIDDAKVKKGKSIFDAKCSACHTMEYKNIGPDISDILAVRKPEWVMNFLLNKNEMLQQDSLAIQTLSSYDAPCEAIVSSETEALLLLEYLRMYQIWLHEFNAL